jgi:hypothetical protein
MSTTAGPHGPPETSAVTADQTAASDATNTSASNAAAKSGGEPKSDGEDHRTKPEAHKSGRHGAPSTAAYEEAGPHGPPS